jgi:hypothetical protein
MVDILEVYFVEHVKKSKDYEGVEPFLVEKCEFALINGEKKRAQSILERIAGYVKFRLPEISDLLAKSLMEDGMYSKAYMFFFKCKNEKQIVECMRTVMKRGNTGEADLFVARACFDMLSRDNDIQKAMYIKKALD